MQGVSGSGKTHWSTRLAPRLSALHLRSDVERKRLLGLDATARPATAGERARRYGAEMGQRTYEHLRLLTKRHLLSDYRVLVDATFLNPDELQAFQALGQTLGVPTVIVHCTAPEAQLRDRVQARSVAGVDASDADLAVLQAQLARGAGAPAGTSLTLTPQSDEVAVLEKLEALLAR
jgi:predicted kinase